MRFIRSPTKCAKIFAFSCLVTFIVLQVLGSMSILPGNQSSIPSNLPGDRNYKSKEQNINDPVNIRHLNKDKAENIVMEGKKEKESPKSEELPKQEQTNSADNSNVYKEHPEVVLLPEDPAPSPGELGQQQINVEADDSLAGQRTHGLPNITGSGQQRSKDSGKDTTTSFKKNEIAHILERIDIINSEQGVKNEDIFGPVENNGTLAVIVVQVHNRIQYLRQLIISFSQAKDIDRTLIIFSHDIWDDEVNELINSVDFAKTLQIFYPYSIQTHTNAFPGESPNDCPRNAKKDQAERLGCINSKWPDLYGHYREAKFTQTKHHWWWKANRIFNELRATMYYNGLVLFLEEDHFAAEDFLSVLSLMKNERDLRYPNCDILCLGTYLKQTNYKEDHRKALLGHPQMLGRPGLSSFPHAARRMLSIQDISYDTSYSVESNTAKTEKHPKSFQSNIVRNGRVAINIKQSDRKHDRRSSSTHLALTSERSDTMKNPYGRLPQPQRSLLWSPPQIITSVLKVFRKDLQLWPGGPNFSQHQRVELTQWLSSKHNMGMAFTRDVWKKIHLCSANFCQFDDYNWDWSLFHVSMTCLKQKLQVMLIKGPRVFHIGECGVHHKKAQCDTEKVVKKVQAILEKANPFLYPKNLIVTTTQAKKNVKLPKGNGGWGDKRDQLMCLNMSTYNSTLLHEQLGESFGL